MSWCICVPATCVFRRQTSSMEIVCACVCVCECPIGTLWHESDRHHRYSVTWVMTHLNTMCHFVIRHVTNERGMSRMNEACHVWASHVTRAEHENKRQATRHHRHCVTCVMPHLHDESSHICMNHVTFAWVMSHLHDESYHICMNHGTFAWDMSHLYASCHIWTWILKPSISVVLRTWCQYSQHTWFQSDA